MWHQHETFIFLCQETCSVILLLRGCFEKWIVLNVAAVIAEPLLDYFNDLLLALYAERD